MTTEEQINLLNERLVKGEITVEEHSQILEIIKQYDPNPTEKSTTSSNEKSFKQLAKYSGIQLWVIVTITLCSPWLWEEKSLPAFLGMLIASTLPIWMVGVVVNFIGWQICVSFLFPTSKTYKIITGIIIVATILLNPFRSYINERAEEKLQEIIGTDE